MDTCRTSLNSESAPSPKILLVATTRWPLGARLASSFLRIGCRVGAVCPVPGHPITKVRGFERLYPYAGQHPLDSLRAGIEDFEPEIIVPFCDRSVQHLHELHATSSSESELDRGIRGLIERSLGAPVGYPIVSSRYNSLMLAAQEGIAVPETIRVDSIEDLKSWENRLPYLLKADGTWGGRGVRRIETLQTGEQVLRELTDRIGVFELAKQLLLNRDRDWILSSLHGNRRGIIAQAIVPGAPANCSVVCWKGEILAGIAVEAVQTDGPMGPAFVVQVVEGRRMLEAAKRISGRLEMTGFFGLDFIIEEGTGNLYLIEMNPRGTPPCSVNLGEGRDLPAAFWEKLSGRKIVQRTAVTEKTRLAYFPLAVLRGFDNSESESCYLDLPSGEPELAQELLHPWSERSLAGRLLDQLRRLLPLQVQRPEWSYSGAQRRNVAL